MRLSLLRGYGLALAIVFVAVPAAAQTQRPVWFTMPSDNRMQLIFGVPESDIAIMAVICTKGSDAIEVHSLIGSRGLKVGDAATVTLSNSKIRKTFSGKAYKDDEGTTANVEGSGKLADFEEVINVGRPFVILVKGARYGLSTNGVQKPLARLVAACRGR
ncbi:hypothetical protein PY365_23335 [Roseiarcaceae bacterium H3SJ34-1]|uniref:hypothetical protein n=1 Tax=Terripilifer ovatus TaxID=3032367 RepID=UPI003AB92837|nr:hypothetical protein [Roseiarcaceae bacterium H3SJ34-1]